jgi:hypothetical protein
VTLRAYASALCALPGIVRDRWRQRDRRRIGTADFLRLLREFPLRATEAALKD